ncbi:MAG TPA: cytochrome c oxidase accessory protein CcoG [Pseudobdellovibrionaceae bacterium]|nr:cytochrome c oxidase accessory protein CcoG [Pseudobdellovibrionaceae bacterium]
MSREHKEHDIGKLTSVDEFGDRIGLIPAEVKGYWKKRRDIVQYILLFIFLALPWTTMNGHQTLLLNMPKREFAIFGSFFKAHDTPLVFFIFAGSAIGLAFITAIWGRIWCGWACPQTVFIEAVYRRIEQWVEGDYLTRRKMRDAPLTSAIFFKKSIKWFLFVVVSSLISHSFIAYFTGSKELVQMIQGSPQENWSYFLIVTFITAIILFDFAWFREQFCIIMCPYGRIQSVLLDQKSLGIYYDTQRGEPRKGKTEPGQKAGDCVACNRCVQVCPTGIDIRNGLQLECIACTACIDACDDIMTKVGKPKGLIRYSPLDGSTFKLFKPRLLIYIVLLVAIVAGFSYKMSKRADTAFTLMKGGAEAPYSMVKNDQQEDSILNHFRVHLHNQGNLKSKYQLSLPQDLIDKGVELTIAQNPLELDADSSFTWHFFIKVKKGLWEQLSTGQPKIIRTQVTISELNNPEKYKETKELIIVGPN